MKDAVSIDLKPTMDVEFSARVDEREGRPVVVPYNQARWLMELGKLKGQDVTVRLIRPKQRRSLAQNAFYWGIVLPDVLSGLRELAVTAGEECPFPDVDSIHEAFKYMYLGVEVVSVPGTDVKMERPSTTTVLTTAQFSSYVEHIIRWAGDRGIPVRVAGEEAYA